jgi:uncharacterized membrane protein YphA (DoxX/SURF4 family)
MPAAPPSPKLSADKSNCKEHTNAIHERRSDWGRLTARGAAALHRFFPSFPDGREGAGLLVLRAVVGVSLCVDGAMLVGNGPSFGATIVAVGVVAAVAGAALLVGLLTPAAAAVAVACGVATLLAWIPSPWPPSPASALATILFMATSAALVLLGPGATSIDARLFGRREIVIPRADRSPRA